MVQFIQREKPSWGTLILLGSMPILAGFYAEVLLFASNGFSDLAGRVVLIIAVVGLVIAMLLFAILRATSLRPHPLLSFIASWIALALPLLGSRLLA